MAKHYTKAELREIYKMISKKCVLRGPFHYWLTEEQKKILEGIDKMRYPWSGGIISELNETQELRQGDFVDFFYQKK